jgi:hypothetical protein
MKGAKVICLNEKAEESIRKHLLEKKTEKLRRRLMYAHMIEEKVIIGDDGRLVFLMTIKEARLMAAKFSDFCATIDEMMLENGCTMQDYIVEEL